MPSLRSLVLIPLLTLTFPTACGPAGKMPTDKGAQNTLETGFQCLLTPSSFDPPGVVFSIDRNGVKDYVADLSSRVQVTTVPAAVGTYQATRALEASAIVKFLNMFERIGAPRLETSVTNKSMVVFTLDPPIQKEITFTPDTTPILAWFADYAVGPLYDSTSRYYLVRDAYIAAGVTYVLDRSLVAGLGGEAAVQQYLNASANVKSATGTVYQLKQTFPHALRVCIRPAPLVPRRPGVEGGAEAQLIENFTDPLNISSVRTEAPRR